MNIKDGIKEFFSSNYSDLRMEIKPIEVFRREFISQFPKNQIQNMQLDDYVVGKEKESFCYWLETTLRPLGSIKGGSTADKKFGVYYNKKYGEYRTILKWDKNKNPETAFSNIKIEISKLLVAGKNVDIDAIIDNNISPMFKHKILSTYFPNDYLSVFSEVHVDYFLKKLNVPFDQSLHVVEKRRILYDFKNSLKEFKDKDNYYFVSFLYWWNNPKVNNIKLLPMSKNMFHDWNYVEIQELFLLDELINNNGYLKYAKKGMNASKGTLVLFQFDNLVIGSARLLDVVKYDESMDRLYKGAFVFDTSSIKVFDPITTDELQAVDNSFKKFSQFKQTIDPIYYEELMALIQLKLNSFLPEEIPQEETSKFSEGSKKAIIVNSYERNPKARKECIRIHGSKCMICDFDFAKVYGEQFEGKIHVHHKKPLSELDDEYEVSPEDDLIPVCPNCHMIIHYKSGRPYTVEEVKAFLNKD